MIWKKAKIPLSLFGELNQYFLSTTTMEKSRNRTSDIFLKVFAFLLPIYFVYYWPLYEKTKDPKIKTLWKYVFTGFVFYLIFGLIYVFRDSLFG